jgi:hypothetical protein
VKTWNAESVDRINIGKEETRYLGLTSCAKIFYFVVVVVLGSSTATTASSLSLSDVVQIVPFNDVSKIFVHNWSVRGRRPQKATKLLEPRKSCIAHICTSLRFRSEPVECHLTCEVCNRSKVLAVQTSEVRNYHCI